MRDAEERFADVVPYRGLMYFKKQRRIGNSHNELVFVTQLEFNEEIIQCFFLLL